MSRFVKIAKSNRQSPLTIVGTGLIALDVIIANDPHQDPLLCAGGTCGNVLTALPYLGWDAYPIARLRSDAASKRVIEDMQSWGVRTDFVTTGDKGSTPVVVQHIKQNKAGKPSHSFSRKCPNCGSWLPWYKAVRAADVSQIAAHLPDATVFYFDRTSRGAIELAKRAHANGCVVVFEPSTGSEPPLLAEALQVSHIVKIASDRLARNDGVLEAKTPRLVVETQGAGGLRFKWRGRNGRSNWRRLPASKGAAVMDTAGAGDWCTAGLLSRLGPLGVDGIEKAGLEDVMAALNIGQAMAAWTCQFHGARGGMYESTKEEFLQAVNGMLPKDPSRLADRKTSEECGNTSPVWCDSCLIGAG